MAISNYEDDPELEMTEEERRLLAEAEGAGTTGTSIGGAIGTGVGAVGGALLGLPTGGALSAPLAGVGAGVGGALGTAAGSLIGNWMGGESAKKFEDMRAARLKNAEGRARKMKNINELVGPWLQNVRGL